MPLLIYITCLQRVQMVKKHVFKFLVLYLLLVVSSKNDSCYHHLLRNSWITIMNEVIWYFFIPITHQHLKDAIQDEYLGKPSRIYCSWLNVELYLYCRRTREVTALILEIGLTQIKSYVDTSVPLRQTKHCAGVWERCIQHHRETCAETRQPFILIFVCRQMNSQPCTVALAYTVTCEACYVLIGIKAMWRPCAWIPLWRGIYDKAFVVSE